MIYGVFDGEYSDWGIVGYFKTREEAEKYCCLHTDCYIYGMEDLTDKEDLSDVQVNYEYEVGFELERDGLVEGDRTHFGQSSWTISHYTMFSKTIRMRDEPNRYNFYPSQENRTNKVEYNFNCGWIYFSIQSHKANDRKRCEKIAQDYLAELYGDKGYITAEDINAMNERFRGE
jgi:hypothetical protein